MNFQCAPDVAEETVISFDGGNASYCATLNTLVPLFNASDGQKGAKDEGSALQEKTSLHGSRSVASSCDDAGEGAAVGQGTQTGASFVFEVTKHEIDPKEDRSASFDVAALADATTGNGTSQLSRSLIACDHPSPASLSGDEHVFEALRSGYESQQSSASSTSSCSIRSSTNDRDVGEFDHLILGYCTSVENSGRRFKSEISARQNGGSDDEAFFYLRDSM